MKDKTEVDHGARAHHEIGGSNYERRLECPGSIFMERGKSSQTSDAAKEGTYFHELLDITGIPLSHYYNKHKKLPAIKDLMNFPTVDNWSRDMQKYAYEWYEGLYNYIELLKPSKIFSEREFKFKGVTPSMGGTADFFFMYKNKKGEPCLFIRDQKYGAGGLIEAGTRQIAFYAAAASSQFSDKYTFNHVIASIHQPRLEDEDGEVEREAQYTGDMLRREVRTALQVHKKCYAIKTREEAEKNLKAGKWCHFCKAAVECPAFVDRQWQDAVIKVPDIEVELEESYGVEEIAAQALVHRLDTPEKMSKFLNYLPLLSDFISKAKERALSMLLDEEVKIPGYKAVQLKGKRRFVKEKKVETADALIKAGIKDPYERKLIGIGAAETEIIEQMLEEAAGQGKKMTKKAAKAEASKIINQFVEKGEPTIIIAPEEDPRHGVTRKVLIEQQFDDDKLHSDLMKEIHDVFEINE